jgi:uncharacterized protein YehS (DUF1456 family)
LLLVAYISKIFFIFSLLARSQLFLLPFVLVSIIAMVEASKRIEKASSFLRKDQRGWLNFQNFTDGDKHRPVDGLIASHRRGIESKPSRQRTNHTGGPNLPFVYILSFWLS